MVRFPFLLSALFSLVCGGPAFAAASNEAYGSSVDSRGDISMPGDFPAAWSHLGSWMVTSSRAAGPGPERFAPGQGFHDVYTQPTSIQAYKKKGAWPDGAVIIMEVRSIAWSDLPTGHVMMQGEPVKWLVMVKDGKGRFPGNLHWGDGWGWAAFRPNDGSKNLSSDYRNDCRGCHEAAKATDRLFIEGYPAVR